MIKIVKTRKVVSSIDRVWGVISSTKNEKKYWPVIENIRVRSRDGNTIEREATIMRGPMGKTKSSQTVILNPKRSIVLKMTKGPLIGTRKMILIPSGEDVTWVNVTWEFELEGIPEFAKSFVKNNISEVTESALIQIAKEAER